MDPSDSTQVLPEPLAALFERRRGRIRYDLATMRAIVSFPEFQRNQGNDVLIVGTNGKGSTTSALYDALRMAQHRCARFTSPHLKRFEERMVIENDMLAPTTVRQALDALSAIESHLPRPYSFFEATLAVALFAVRRARIHTVVWEAGLGGRLDATNSLPSSILAAVGVTPIGLDHQEILGADIQLIAQEKAGVFRPDVPVVSAPQHPQVRDILQRQADAIGAPIHFVERDQVAERCVGLHHQPAYQQINVALADALAETLDKQGTSCPADARRTARTQFCWPGRYQWLAPDASIGPCAWLIDGAHNLPAAIALSEALAQDTRLHEKRIKLLFSALEDKDADSIVDSLLPHVHEVHAAPCAGTRSRSPQQLSHLRCRPQVHASVADALLYLQNTASEHDVIVVTGSLMLVGEVSQRLRA